MRPQARFQALPVNRVANRYHGSLRRPVNPNLGLIKHHGIYANQGSVSHFGCLTSSAAGTEELSPARTTAG
jgi:hypothetical protein